VFATIEDENRVILQFANGRLPILGLPWAASFSTHVKYEFRWHLNFASPLGDCATLLLIVTFDIPSIYLFFASQPISSAVRGLLERGEGALSGRCNSKTPHNLALAIPPHLASLIPATKWEKSTIRGKGRPSRAAWEGAEARTSAGKAADS